MRVENATALTVHNHVSIIQGKYDLIHFYHSIFCRCKHSYIKKILTEIIKLEEAILLDTQIKKFYFPPSMLYIVIYLVC
jgi:hypothetical protein